eukprot:CAMPEP_0197028730 /NCGR_PEP_ID=MMETSP1384-20130603/8340_1 /TAXON_ID=29189 /ORGANISM="Ammonia sp." /LENGTH=439 /DNA_ID=CAMNT_0042457773 /DNA_START=112 /DNA_END=1431 /DNA_ORIENTATION=-
MAIQQSLQETNNNGNGGDHTANNNNNNNEPPPDYDNLGELKFNEAEEAPPTFTRRMSTQLSMQLERQTSVLDQATGGVGGFQTMVGMIPGMNRGKSTKQLKATYFCHICFMKNPVDEGFCLRDCEHMYCIECIKNFCRSKISHGVVYLKCFHPVDDNNNTQCSVDIHEEDIHQLVDGDTWSKYQRFKSNLENAMSRQCPYCSATSIGEKDVNTITCSNSACGKQYCVYHSNAHAMDETCESYELRTAKETKINEMAMKEMGDGCKPCPQCEFRIVKNGGCNHMKCVKCGCSFCWLCCEVVEDAPVPSHYKDENSKCNGQQFTGDSEQPPVSILIIMVICMCLFCIPGLALGCVFGCLLHPCVVFLCNPDKNIFETITMCAFVFMMIPAVVVIGIVIILWSGLKSIYDNIQSVCSCLPNCPQSCAWIDRMHAQQREPQPV